MTGAPILLVLLALFAAWTLHAILSGPTHDQCGPCSGEVPGERDG